MSTPEPSEIMVERVARALRKVMETEHPADGISADEWLRHLATAALAAMPAHPAEAALRQRIEHLIDPETGMAWLLHGDRVFRERDLRAAIAAPQTGEHATEEEAGRG